MDNRASNRILLLGLATVVSVLVINAGLSYQNLHQVKADARSVSHSWQVMTGLENVLSLAKDAETGQRGFIITGDPSYLKPFNSAVASINTQVDELERLTIDNPSQHARFPEVRERIAAKLKELYKAIALRKDQGIDAARRQVMTGTGKKEMDALRAVIGSMIQHEQEIVREREGTTDQAYQTAVVTGILTALVGLAAVAMFVWLLERSQRSRRQVEQALRQGEARLRFVMDSMPQKIFTAKANGDVDYFNPQWTKFTGLAFEQIKDWGWKQFVHPDDVAENVRAWKYALDNGQPFEFEQRFRRADGEYRWHVSRALPQRDTDGRIVMWVGSNTDIHEQRQTADRLRQLAAELSEADHRKDEFLATLAHELRNPMAPIRNGLQLMRLANGQPATIEEARSMMERQLAQLIRLVDDLMDVSRITRGRLELRKEYVGLAAVVSSAVESSRPLIEDMGHKLTVALPKEPVTVNADPTRLAQVFMNLLTNAAKYTERGGQIRLAAEREGSDVVVSVTDTGIGISADQLPRIFEMFSQIDRSLEKAQGGLGIGLTLVKRLVEMHGGTIEAKSAGLGKGSEFSVRLPIALGAAGAAESGAAERTPMKSSLRILIVDDNHDGADSLALMLKAMGNDVRTAYDGLQGIELAAQMQPDVVLLDIGLPKLNGYEACRRIRGQPWGHKIVIIAVTGWGQEDDMRRSREAGFDHHLVKPVDPQTLMKLLAELRSVTAER